MMPDERFERIERQMEFLAQQQAQFFASMQAQQQQISHHSDQIGQMFEVLSRTVTVVEGLAQRVKDLTQRVDDLAQAQLRTDENLNRLGDRVSILIGVVERYFSGGPGR